MPLTNFPHGVSSFGSPVMGPGTISVMGGRIAASGDAKVYFVDPANGSDGNTGLSPSQALDTVSAAYDKTVDKSGDTIYLLNDGNTSGTSREDATITWANDNVHLVGLCAPALLSQRARISPTAATTAVTPQLTVSGNGNIFQNISFFEGNTTAADSTCVSVTGNRNVFNNVAMMNLGGNTSGDARTRAGSNHLLITGGEENYFNNCYIGLDTTARSGANSNIKFASAAARNYFYRCTIPMHTSAATPLFIDANSSGAVDRWTIFDNCDFINAVGSTATELTQAFSIHASAGGVIYLKHCGIIGAATFETTASTNLYLGMPVADSAGADAGGKINPWTA